MGPILASPPNVFEDIFVQIGVPVFLIVALSCILVRWYREAMDRIKRPPAGADTDDHSPTTQS